MTNINAADANDFGPNNCLLTETNNCPVSFMLKAFCMRDSNSCFNLSGSNYYALNDAAFLYNYSEQLFGTAITEDLIPLFSVMDWYPVETLHEIFEYGICLNSPESCYLEGENGLTIYHEDNSCSAPCQGGPSDAAICQVTPEACSGLFEPD